MKYLSFVAAAAIAFSMALTSCSKSNQDLINQLKEQQKELTEATNKGDFIEAAKITAKIAETAQELEKRDLTPEEEAEILSIE